jgi:hypothetical protein
MMWPLRSFWPRSVSGSRSTRSAAQYQTHTPDPATL